MKNEKPKNRNPQKPETALSIFDFEKTGRFIFYFEQELSDGFVLLSHSRLLIRKPILKIISKSFSIQR